MLLRSAKCPRPLGRRENSVWKKIWRTIQRGNKSFWSNGWISSIIYQFGKKVLPGIFLGHELLAWWIWEGDILIADSQDLEKLDLSEIHPRRLYAKGVLITHKGDEFLFLVAECTAKLSGGDYKFREPTPRREPTVRSGDFSRELQGEPEESQPTESTDDAEARAEFWSIQVTFIYRHHNEPRIQLYVPKEETFPIPLKYIGVTRSVHTDLDVMQEKTYWRLLEGRFKQKPVRFLERFHEVHSIERKTSHKIHVVRENIDKNSIDYQTRSCMARCMDENWLSRAESGNTRMGKREVEARQCSETERDVLYRCWRPTLQRNSQKCEKKIWKDLWHPSCLVKEKLQVASRKCLHNRRLHPRRLQKRFTVE